MKPKIPADIRELKPLRDAYCRGWIDRGAASARKAGSTMTEAKISANQANGRKGGRPRTRIFSQVTLPHHPT